MGTSATQKRITVVIAGTGEFKDLTIEIATTAGDILQAIGHADYRLSRGEGPPFADGDDVYEQVSDGSKIYAAPHAEAGAPVTFEAVQAEGTHNG